MYRLALQRRFNAQHFLIGGDWGPENEPHSHDYRLEVTLEGSELDAHGFLIDLVDFEELMDGLVDSFEGQRLNDQPEFAQLNPSLEHFSRIVAKRVAEQVPSPPVQVVNVRLWENDEAWAWYRLELQAFAAR